MKPNIMQSSEDNSRVEELENILHSKNYITKLQDELKKAKSEVEQHKINEFKIASLIHDLNNALTGVRGFASVGLVSEDYRKDYCFDNVVKSTDTCSKLVEKIKGAYNPDKENEKTKIDVSCILKQAIRTATVKSKVKSACNLTEKFYVHACDTEIIQLLLNPLVNAKQAIKEEGKLEVSICDYIPCKEDNLNSQKQYIKISISDNGEGIPDKIRNQIFDTHFTTKENGSGLGLATVRRIVDKYKGMIKVKSEQGKGTTFDIYLPKYASEK